MPRVTAVIELPDSWTDDEGKEYADAFKGSTYFGYFLEDWLKTQDATLLSFHAGGPDGTSN